jgi:hypothetical protein
MERKKKTNTFWIIAVVFQSVLIVAITLWAITQKVEADKQRYLSILAQQEAMKARKDAEEAKRMAEMAKDEALKQRELNEQQKKIAEMAKEEALKQKELSDKILKRKK